MKIEPLVDGRIRCTVSVRYKHKTAKCQEITTPDQVKEIEPVLTTRALEKISWGNRPMETTTDLLDWVYMEHIDMKPGRKSQWQGRSTKFRERRFPELENIPLNDFERIQAVLKSIGERSPASYNNLLGRIRAALKTYQEGKNER